MKTASDFFERLLQAASAQSQPQRLLFVFAQSELPADATPVQRAEYEAGRGGTLTPMVCVDKGTSELSSFEALLAQSREACPPWQAVFIAALGGRDGREPEPATIESALKTMVENVRAGRFAGYMTLAPTGEPLQFA